MPDFIDFNSNNSTSVIPEFVEMLILLKSIESGIAAQHMVAYLDIMYVRNNYKH